MIDLGDYKPLGRKVDVSADLKKLTLQFKHRLSRHLFVKPRIKVPKLSTCSRIPRRRDMLEDNKCPLDFTLKTDLQIWQHHPENVSMENILQTNMYATKIYPRSRWNGTFDGRRFFRGRLPNHYEWKDEVLAVKLERYDDGLPLFTLVNDNHEEDWKKTKELMAWYYNGRPGQKLLASHYYCEDGQILVVRADRETDDYRRGRFLKKSENRPFSIIKDLDSGQIFPAEKHDIFAMDPQFLKMPYRAFRCVITNRGALMDKKIVQRKWPLFFGTDTVADIEQVLPKGLENQNRIFLTNFKVDRTMEECICADMSLDFNKRSPLLEPLQNILTNQILTRFQNVENYKCQVTNVLKDGSVWLCTDPKLLNGVQAYINDRVQKPKIRQGKLKAAAEFGLESTLDWFQSLLMPGQGFIVVGNQEETLYRAVFREQSPNRPGYLVDLIDFGITRRLFNVDEFWCVLPNPTLPSYINLLPPLAKKYHLEGINSISCPHKIMNQFYGSGFTVQVTDAERMERVKQRYLDTYANVPLVLLKAVADNGDVTYDVNKNLADLQRSMGGRPFVSSTQFYVQRGDKSQKSKSNSENQPITRRYGT